MELLKLILITAAVLSGKVIAGKHDIYSRHSVYGVKLSSPSDQGLLHEFEAALSLDVWQDGHPGHSDALVMVSPDQADLFLELLDSRGMEHYLYLADVATAFEEYDQERLKNASKSSRNIFQEHPRYAEVDSYMESLAAQYPNLVTVVNAGTSFEGRDIKYLRISTTNFEDRSKPIYFMDAMIHAREWVTTPLTLYSMYRLVENLRTEDRDLLEDTDWIILPIVNPDGYEYTHETERLWRRTRSYYPEVSDTCYGVDANRNFDIDFNTVGVDSNPCSNTYPGHLAFSENETQIVRNIMFEHIDRIQLYLNIHSYGNYVLFGYGSTQLPANAAALHYVGAAFGAAMDATKLPQAGYYLVGNSALVLYPTSGSAQDYGQSVGIPFSYTLELPAYGYDFRVPVEYQDQINEETWQGIATSARLSVLYYRSRFTG